jgi:hypothetical protein
MGLIVEEVVERLTAQLGCEVEVTVEISENSRTLKSEHYGFEEG